MVIDVVLIAPVRAYRDALAKAMSTDAELHLVAHAASGAEALARMGARHPAVALLDFGMDDVLPVLGSLRRTVPMTHLIAIGVGARQAQSEAVICAAEAGVTGFVDADQPLSDVVGAVRLAVCGQSSCSPRIAALLLQALQRRPGPPLMPRLPAQLGAPPSELALTPRELVVAELAARGLTNRQIAARLVVGESTVKTHVHAVLRKLGLDRREQIVLAAVLRMAPSGSAPPGAPPGGGGVETAPPPQESTSVR